MLGFSTYAQVPYAQAVTSVATTALLTGGAPATSSAGSLTGTGIASLTNPSASATISLGTIKPNINKELQGVSATTALNPDVFPNVQEDLTSVSATLSLGTIEIQVTEPFQIGVEATGSVGSIEATGKAQTTLDDAPATASLGITTMEVTVTVDHELVGVSASHTFNKPTQTAVQKTYSNTDYIQVHVVTISAKKNNKIVYVRRA